MIHTRTRQKSLQGVSWLIAICLCLLSAGAVADALMPMMPAPVDTPVYWQLQSIVQEPTVTASGGYTVEYEAQGLDLDLSDGLLTQSLIDSDPALSPSLSLTIAKGDQTMRHTYAWTALPIYLEPNVEYAIDVQGTEDVKGGLLSTLFGLYTQGMRNARISASGYTGHVEQAAFVVDASNTSLYKDGSLVISFVLRDVHEMFRLRVIYTYEMHGGIKPEPTPIPGFVAVEMPTGVLPSYYDAVDSKDALWVVTTAAGEYRAYGSMSGSEPMFFPADAEGNVVMDEKPANVKTDYDQFVKGYVPTALQGEVPSYYRVANDAEYEFTTRDGGVMLRVYGRVDGGESAFYPLDETGEVVAEPVQPEDDYATHIEGFGAAQPPTLYEHYESIEKDLYAFTGRDGETRYRVFGRLDGAEPSYYETTPEGEITKNTPVKPDEDFASFIKGFDATQPEDLPTYYQIATENVYAVVDRQGEPVYRAYGVKDGAEPAFYPANMEGVVPDSAVAIDMEEDFITYVAGFEPVSLEKAEIPVYYEGTNTPGVWTFIDVSGNEHFRAYGNLNREGLAFYPADQEGNVAIDALQVLPASDLAIIPAPEFVQAVPAEDEVPEFYSLVREDSSLYAFNDREGEAIYRVYGAYGRSIPNFYPADVEGNPIENAGAVTPVLDYAEYIQGFEALVPETVPVQYTPVGETGNLFSFVTREGKTVYRVYGTNDRSETGFFPADEAGNLQDIHVTLIEEDVPLMATSIAYAVVTPNPSQEGQGIIYGSIPAPVEPTSFVSTVVEAGEPEGTNEPIARFIPAPEIPEDEPVVATTEAAAVNVDPTATETSVVVPAETGTIAPEETGTVAPEITPESTPEPTETPAVMEDQGLSTWWIALIAAGVAAVGGGGYALFRKKK